MHSVRVLSSGFYAFYGAGHCLYDEADEFSSPVLVTMSSWPSQEQAIGLIRTTAGSPHAELKSEPTEHSISTRSIGPANARRWRVLINALSSKTNSVRSTVSNYLTSSQVTTTFLILTLGAEMRTLKSVNVFRG